jgi:hypothetical protein
MCFLRSKEDNGVLRKERKFSGKDKEQRETQLGGCAAFLYLAGTALVIHHSIGA